MYRLNWNKCQGDVWCNLLNVNLQHAHFDGMEGNYIIWHAGNPSKTVRVGSGIIRDRLTAHRDDVSVLRYKDFGLYVTWASVVPTMQDGVERFLATKLTPLVGDRYPNVDPVEVNLPW